MGKRGLLQLFPMARDGSRTVRETYPVRWRLEHIRQALRAADTRSDTFRAQAIREAEFEIAELELALFGQLPTIGDLGRKE